MRLTQKTYVCCEKQEVIAVKVEIFLETGSLPSACQCDFLWGKDRELGVDFWPQWQIFKYFDITTDVDEKILLMDQQFCFYLLHLSDSWTLTNIHLTGTY